MAQTAQTVSFPSGSQQLSGYLARPQGEGPFPGIVVIHEIFGLNDNIRDIARRFADEGYVALAVDLFTGGSRLVCMFRFMRQSLLSPLNNSSINHLARITFKNKVCKSSSYTSKRFENRVGHGLLCFCLRFLFLFLI